MIRAPSFLIRSFSTRIARHSTAAANVRLWAPSAPIDGSVTRPHQEKVHRAFSSSHDDFAPQPKTSVPSSEEDVHALLQKHIDSNPVMLYMKGNPSQPMCGFSAKVVAILRQYNMDYASVNVLDYPSIRNGIKTFSNWPTIPQLYIGGEFIGGSDIVESMQESGELEELLRKAVPPPLEEDPAAKKE